jgi:hypothetical protein
VTQSRGSEGAERVSGRSSRVRLREVARLAAVAIVVPLAGWAFWALVLHLGPNDFHDYWLAGRLILQGHSPYDSAAMHDLAAREHLSFTLGGGYSYPLPFAVAMIPLGALPFEVAVVAFDVLSLAAFGLTAAVWSGWATGWAPELGRRRLVVAFLAGAYPPVYGSLAMGQANLILLPLMAAGTALALAAGRASGRIAGGALVGLVAVVKLVPGALVVPLALGRKLGAAVACLAAAAAAFGLAVLAVPWATAGSGGLASLFDPDHYYTNQSINGFVTRLVEDGDRSRALWHGAFDPRLPMLALSAAFGLLTLAILWRHRAALALRRGLAVGLGLTLVAATASAPKTSFWNESAVLVAVGLLLAVDYPGSGFRRWLALDWALVATWFGSAVVWAVVWAVEPPASGPLSALVTLLWSVSLVGLAALWWLFARRLGLEAAEPQEPFEPQEAAPSATAPPPTAPSPTIS